MQEGHFERHVSRMRRLYANRRSAMVGALDAEFQGLVRRDPAMTEAGLHLLVGFDLSLSESEIVARAADAGVSLERASPCYIAAPPPLPSMLLGYAHLPEDDIRKGIRTLAGVLRDDGLMP